MMLVLFLPSFIKINLLEPKSNTLVRILEAQFLNGRKVKTSSMNPLGAGKLAYAAAS